MNSETKITQPPVGKAELKFDSRRYPLAVDWSLLPGDYERIVSTLANPPIPPVADQAEGHCSFAKRLGGCPLNDVQCGWPECDQKLSADPTTIQAAFASAAKGPGCWSLHVFEAGYRAGMSRLAVADPPMLDAEQLAAIPGKTFTELLDWSHELARREGLWGDPTKGQHAMRMKLREELISRCRVADPSAEAKPVAWGFPNSAITGMPHALMLVRLDIPSDDQYNGAFWIPLYAAPPPPQIDREKLVAFMRTTIERYTSQAPETARAVYDEALDKAAKESADAFLQEFSLDNGDAK